MSAPQGWALDPWSEGSSRWIAVHEAHYYVRFARPKPANWRPLDIEAAFFAMEEVGMRREHLRSPYLGDFYVYGDVSRTLPLLRQAECVVALFAWLKRITEAP